MSREQDNREVERAPPRVDRCGVSPLRSAERCKDERGTRRGLHVRRDLLRAVTGVLVVLVERDGPRHLLRRRVERERARELARGSEDRACDVTDRPVGRERYPPDSPVGVLDDRLVGAQIEGGDDPPSKTIGSRYPSGGAGLLVSTALSDPSQVDE